MPGGTGNAEDRDGGATATNPGARWGRPLTLWSLLPHCDCSIPRVSGEGSQQKSALSTANPAGMREDRQWSRCLPPTRRQSLTQFPR